MAAHTINIGLDPSIQVEVIRLNQDKTEVLGRIMTLHEWMTMKKNRAYEYHCYQIGFSQYQLTQPIT